MGAERREKIAEGVWKRTYASGRLAYEIQFTYQGESCRETLKFKVTKSNDRVATNKRAAVYEAINTGKFDYAEWFPDSKRARRFGTPISRLTLEEYGTRYLESVKKSYPHSTFNKYEQAFNNWAVPSLGKKLMTEITPDDLRERIRATQRTCRNRADPDGVG